VQIRRGPAAVTGDKCCTKATVIYDGKAQQEDDPEARRPDCRRLELACSRGIGTGHSIRLDEKRHPSFGFGLEGGFFIFVETVSNLSLPGKILKSKPGEQNDYTVGICPQGRDNA